MARGSGETLLRVINDILDFSKIESGKLELEELDFNLPDLVRDVVKMMAVPARQKELELVCDLKPGVPQMVCGDSARLRQILFNLLGNAIKFTAAGEIVIEVSDCGPAAGKREILFRVARYRNRHPPGKAGSDFPAFLAGRQQHHSKVRRHRAGTHHRVSPGLDDGRPHLAGERSRQRQPFLFTVQFGSVRLLEQPSDSAGGL